MYFNGLAIVLFSIVCGGFSVKYKDMYMFYKLISLITKPFGGYVMDFYFFYGDIT